MRKEKRSVKQILLTVIQLLALVIFLACGYTYLKYQMDYKAGEDTYNKVSADYVQTQPSQPDVELRLIKVDFDSLTATNPDVCGWLDFPVLNISYPVLQGETNETYLYHMFNGEYNRSGSIFLDSAHARDFSDALSILYGHNMQNGAMLAGLTNYLDPAWYSSTDLLALYQPGQETPTYYQVAAFAQVAADADFYFEQYQLGSPEYSAFLDWAMSKALYPTGVILDSSKPTLALSTCTDDGSQRLVAFCQPWEP